MALDPRFRGNDDRGCGRWERRLIMPAYQPPLRDMRFVLFELHGARSLSDLPGYQEATPDLFQTVLEAAGSFMTEELLPLNRSGDEEGSHFENGTVRTPAGFKQAYGEFAAGGWISLAADPAYGGQGLPLALHVAVEEMICSTNLSFGMYPRPQPGRLQRPDAPWLRGAEAALPAGAGRRQRRRHHVPDRAAMRHGSGPRADQGRARRRRQLQDHGIEDLHLRRRARPDGEHPASGAGAAARRAGRDPRHQPVPGAQAPARRPRAIASPAAASRRRWASTPRPPA